MVYHLAPSFRNFRVLRQWNAMIIVMGTFKDNTAVKYWLTTKSDSRQTGKVKKWRPETTQKTGRD